MATYEKFVEQPPSYTQSYPTAPTAETLPQPSGLVPMQIEGQQQQQQNPIYHMPLPPLGPKPCHLTCPFCHQKQTTTIRDEVGTKTHIFALITCLLGCLCCTCIPYFLRSCKNINHYCSNCDTFLGRYND